MTENTTYTTNVTPDQRRKRRFRIPVTAAVALCAAAAALAGCGSKERVCQGSPENVVVVPSTSNASLPTARAMAPDVAGQALVAAVDSCGRLAVGLQDAHPAADLELHIKEFVPQSKQAFNRNPQINQMTGHGNAFVQANLLTPLARITPTAGEPMLGALVKIAGELSVRGYARATIVMIGTGLEKELAPDGTSIDLSTASNPAATELLAQRLREFEPLLRPLAGSCVILVGADASSTLPDSTLLAGQALLGQTLAGAGVGYVATRSSDLPSRCRRGPGLSIARPQPRTVVATLSSDVVFQINSATLQPGAQPVLHGLLEPLAHAQTVQVNGYTDITGGDGINEPLSQARAKTVAVWIERHSHVAAGQVHTQGLGSSDPVVSNATTAGRAANRRVVITIREG
jgi:outer membrane protein OmpA-like peptidoglycan-associated protein